MLREYKKEDFKIVEKIIKEAFNDDFKDIDAINVFKYVYEYNDVVVGFCVVTYIDNVVKGYKYALIDYVCIDPSYQGKGLGKKMMTEVLSKFNNIKYAQLTSSNKRVVARHMYESLGFELYDTNMYRLHCDVK